MNVTFEIRGLPELAKRIDTIATMIAGPIAKAAVSAGGALIKAEAERNVHRLTGTLASDIIVKVVQRDPQTYAVIGPGWDPNAFRRVAESRGARSREVHADQTTNPGVYGYFLEMGHRAPGAGLASNNEYRRDAAAARKRGARVNTRDCGHLSTPPYPFLGPAVESQGSAALAAAADVIEARLAEQGI